MEVTVLGLLVFVGCGEPVSHPRLAACGGSVTTTRDRTTELMPAPIVTRPWPVHQAARARCSRGCCARPTTSRSG